MRELADKYKAEWERFPRHQSDTHEDGYFVYNDAFTTVDGELLYGMVRHFEPQNIIEVGSGHSSRVVGMALAKNGGETRFTSIEPYPLPWVKAGNHGLTEVLAKKVQDVPIELYSQLQAGDILFIDSSHTVAAGSDVVHLVLNVLPNLNPGVVVHIHDIFMPVEYPERWIKELKIFWNEQYLVQAFLAHNAKFEILVGASWMHVHASDVLQQAFDTYRPGQDHPSSLWIRRKG